MTNDVEKITLSLYATAKKRDNVSSKDNKAVVCCTHYNTLMFLNLK
jgi:hypothetical protein